VLQGVNQRARRRAALSRPMRVCLGGWENCSTISSIASVTSISATTRVLSLTVSVTLACSHCDLTRLRLARKNRGKMENWVNRRSRTGCESLEVMSVIGASTREIFAGLTSVSFSCESCHIGTAYVTRCRVMCHEWMDQQRMCHSGTLSMA
jgi:hypothetical protein